MQIYVPPANWGDALLENIEVLLKDTASHLNRLFRTPFDGTICVRPSPPDEKFPRVLYRRSPDAPFVIWLTARNRQWSQFAYQFSHEFCHVLSDYENLKENPNNWFHEAICELASVFTLRRMAERWPTRPPCPNWADYAESLSIYWQYLLPPQAVQLPEGVPLQEWLSSHEDELRKNEYQREKNALVAYALLPIFESTPTGWNAIRKLPNSSGKLADYLVDWYLSVDHDNRNFVARLSDAFGYTIAPSKQKYYSYAPHEG